ncbi:MAG: phage tail tape measure protein, partial [Bacteroidales bacterium]
MALNETARTRVELDANQAKEQLKQLTERSRELKDRLSELGKANDLAGTKKLSKELRGVEAEMRALKKATNDVDAVMKNLSGASINQLNAAYRKLSGEVKTMTRGTDEYNAKVKQLLTLEAQRTKANSDLRSSIGANNSMMSTAANTFNKYAASSLALIGTITGLSYTFRKLSEEVAKMDDVYADVMKTTGATREEVVDLNEAFKEMNTRTSREQLNLLARDAGKLGISGKKDILDFVEAGNQINVALGEDLGEGAIKNIGKIVDLFKKSQDDLAALDLKGQMLAVGSAINELGQSSTASEAYLVSFAGRLGGVASQADISIQNILGYASALDQNMQGVEMSATAFSKFVMNIYSEPAKFAKIAGQDVKKFTDLLRNDANAAIKTVLQSLNEKGGFEQLVPIFKDMGTDGSRAVSVLAAMASNIDKVTEAQAISNTAFAEGTSITNEYAVKNENLQAQLEKARKKFKEAALDLGERLTPAMLSSTNATSYLIRLLPTVLDWFMRWSGVIITATATIGSYVVAVKLAALWTTNFGNASIIAVTWTKAKTVANVAATAATQLYAAATMALTGNIGGATQAMRIFNATMKSSPIGLIASLVVGVGVAIWQYTSRTKEAIETTKNFANIMDEAKNSTDGEIGKMQALLAVAKDENTSQERRIEAIKELNALSPEHLGSLSLENINTKEATTATNNYTDALIRNAQAKALQDELAKLFGEKLRLDRQIAEQEQKLLKQKEELLDGCVNNQKF